MTWTLLKLKLDCYDLTNAVTQCLYISNIWTIGEAKSGSSPTAGLLHHFLRLEEQHRGHREAKRLCGLEVDDEIEFYGLLHGEVGRLGTFQDLVHISGDAPVHVGLAWPIGHQATSRHEIAEWVERW